MYHNLYMKLSDKFDPNQMYTSDKSGKTHFCERNTFKA